MKSLGLAYGFHDSSAALVVDGRIVAAHTEERFTRQKHDSFFPQFAIESCLRSAGLQSHDLDVVVFYENTPRKFSRILKSILTNWPHARQEFSSVVKSWLGQKLWTRNQIVSRLNISPDRILFMDHHQAHAYQAFVGSGFEEAAILTVDSVGEWSTTGLSQARWENGQPVFQSLSESSYPHSLGLFYSAMTAFLGFKPMNDECTTMALAAFGAPRFADFFRSVVQIREGKVWLDPDCFQFDSFFQSPFRAKLKKTLGEPASNPTYSFSSFEEISVAGDEQRLADIAASVQKVFEECILALAQDLKARTGSKNLCWAGGAALNCVANTRLLRESGFENVFIPIDPGDGGAALGAAGYGHFQSQKSSPQKFVYQAHLGPNSRDFSNFAETVRQIDMRKLKKFSKFSQSDVQSWQVEEFASQEALLQVVAQELHNYQIVGWFQGAAEYGPRALGHRSILIRPDHRDLALRLSQRVKERALFRPYALAMTEEAAPKILAEAEKVLTQRPSEWMQLALATLPSVHRQVASGLHIDGTTRPQVVRKHNVPDFHRLLEVYGHRSGLACLINTSFNESGYPIVQTPFDALLMFARTDMDILVVDKTLIRKARTPYVTSK